MSQTQDTPMRILIALALAFPLGSGLQAQSDPADPPQTEQTERTGPSKKKQAELEKLAAKKERLKKKNEKEIQRKRNQQAEEAEKARAGVTRDIRKNVAKRRRESGHIYSDPGPRGLSRQERGLPPLPMVGEPELTTAAEDKRKAEELAAPQTLDVTGRGKRTPQQVAALRAVLEEDGKHRRRLAQLERLHELAVEADQPFRKREVRDLQGREEARHQARIEELRAEYGDATCRRAAALADVYAAKGKGRGR